VLISQPLTGVCCQRWPANGYQCAQPTLSSWLCQIWSGEVRGSGLHRLHRRLRRQRLHRHELRLGERGEAAADADQLVEGAGLDDAAVLEHEDAGGVAHGREPVGDHEGGAVLHHLVERRLHLALGFRVQRAGGFVEDEDGRVLEDGAGDREALALAAGQRAAAFADRRRERVRRALDEVERLGALGGVAHFGLGGVGLADPQVFGDRAVEQQRLLVDDADVAPERGELDVADVDAVDLDHPGLRVEGAVEQRQRGRLAGPGAADQRDGFPGERR